jgi:hypothetical protein
MVWKSIHTETAPGKTRRQQTSYWKHGASLSEAVYHSIRAKQQEAVTSVNALLQRGPDTIPMLSHGWSDASPVIAGKTADRGRRHATGRADPVPVSPPQLVARGALQRGEDTGR